MYVTLAGIVMEVRLVAPLNALFPIDVTPSGITAAPAHEFPSNTAPEVIVKFGVELDATPVVQR